IWVLVDKFSSAHTSFASRQTLITCWGTSYNILQALLDDCAELTKANSIEGNKKDNVTVIYNPWENLKKTQGMIKKVFVETLINATMNRLNKTRI
ncbi:hypothetical protein BJ742DRAFT_668586, partial [Cladochytrium replicatum]